MPSIARKYDSTSSNEISSGYTHDAVFLLRDCSDEFQARQVLEQNVSFTEEGQWNLGYTIKNIGPTQYEATVKYGIPTLAELEFAKEHSPSLFTLATFSSMGGTAHITQSLDTNIHAITEADPPDFGGAIGVTDSNIEGCDVPTPKLEFVIHSKKPLTVFSDEYVKFLALSTGMTNHAPWLGFQKRELVFLGFDGTLSSDGQFAMAFKFGASPSRNVTVTVDGETTEIYKRGWEYLWFRYKKKVDAAAKAMVHRPLAAYVEQVMYDLDFTTLMVF